MDRKSLVDADIRGERLERISDRIVSLRQEMGIRQSELSRRLGMPQATLSGYENGHREVGAEWLPKIAELFDVSVDYLLGMTAARKSSLLLERVFLDIEDEPITNGDFFDKLEKLTPEAKTVVNSMVEMLTK